MRRRALDTPTPVQLGDQVVERAVLPKMLERGDLPVPKREGRVPEKRGGTPHEPDAAFDVSDRRREDAGLDLEDRERLVVGLETVTGPGRRHPLDQPRAGGPGGASPEWTGDGRLRHPRFLGLREDKDPADVVRERPATPR